MLTLKKNYEFQRVFKKGSWFGGDFLSIYVAENHKNSNYIGIAVSKKISKSSVKRNRIRRIIREVYRIHEKEFLIGLDLVMVFKSNRSFEDASFQAIEKDMMKIFTKADLIKKEDYNAK